MNRKYAQTSFAYDGIGRLRSIPRAADCQSTLKQLKLHNPQVVLCDVFLPDGNGVDMVTTIKKLYPELEVILLTAHGNIPMVCRQSRMEPLIISPKGMIIIKLFR